MKNRLRKKMQRQLNSYIRDFNKSIENDYLWLGRFVIVQKDSGFEAFEDHSGGILYAGLRMIDKATGYYKDFTYDHSGHYGLWKIWQFANKFITEFSGAWDNGEPEAVDYRNVPLPQVSEEKNYFVSYKYFNEVK